MISASVAPPLRRIISTRRGLAALAGALRLSGFAPDPRLADGHHHAETGRDRAIFGRIVAERPDTRLFLRVNGVTIATIKDVLDFGRQRSSSIWFLYESGEAFTREPPNSLDFIKTT